MSTSPSAPYLQILQKLNHTCEKYGHHFVELHQLKMKIEEVTRKSEGNELEDLQTILAFMKQAKSEELALKLVFLSFMRDLESFRQGRRINELESDYLT